MILLCGIPSESPLRMVSECLGGAGTAYTMLNQRSFASSEISFDVDRGQCGGVLETGGVRYDLGEFSAVYTRMMDDRNLPELRGEPAQSALRSYCRSFHDALTRWM